MHSRIPKVSETYKNMLLLGGDFVFPTPAVLGLDEADEGNFSVGFLDDVLRPDGERQSFKADPYLSFRVLLFDHVQIKNGDADLWWSCHRHSAAIEGYPD